MAKLQFSFITGENERVEPVINGAVPIEGAELITTYSDPSETFWRQLNFQEFEISEMSLSSYLIAKSHGMDMTAIPVFPRVASCIASFPITSIPASSSRKISSASASAWESISKPRPYGCEVYWNMISACRSTKSIGTWSEARN